MKDSVLGMAMTLPSRVVPKVVHVVNCVCKRDRGRGAVRVFICRLLK